MKRNNSQIIFLFIFFILPWAETFSQSPCLMPYPSQVQMTGSRFTLGKGFTVIFNESEETRAYHAVTRFLKRLNDRTHLMLQLVPAAEKKSVTGPYLQISYSRKGVLVPKEDESYKLEVSGDFAQLNATTDLGMMHGLETLLQLLEEDNIGFYFPGCEINDVPRFTWRGLMIDVGRHFQPVDVIKRNLDGMAMVKLNVLHLHLSEDQGFRIESKKFPELHQRGSEGDFFTQSQITDLIQYAGDRGIRVVPEFDMPGHATSWFVSHPELASAPGHYKIETKFGVFDPTMDPTKKSTYRFLKKFLTEMCELFPDPYFHIGGDENEGKQWNANKKITAFKEKHKFKDNHELQNYFNLKVSKILQRSHKTMIGWDEILQKDLPEATVIQSWRGQEGVARAVNMGHPVILSNGYYIDLSNTAAFHYMNDPLPESTSVTDPAKRALVLGGEATMWSELVDPVNIDSRIWPRTAAIAERLWSPASVNNIEEMYDRLENISLQLECVGLQHLTYQDKLLRSVTNGEDIAELKALVQLVEPLKNYQRGQQGVPYSTKLPLTRLPDIASPDSRKAREFSHKIEKYLADRDSVTGKMLMEQFEEWAILYQHIAAKYGDKPSMKGFVKMAENLNTVAKTGLNCLTLVSGGSLATDTGQQAQWTDQLKAASLPVEESELMVVAPVQKLLIYVNTH